MQNLSFVTRDQARNVARAVNAGNPAKLRQPVKGVDGRWIFPGINHGHTLTLKK